MKAASATMALTLAVPALAYAQDAAPQSPPTAPAAPPPDKSGFNLFDPTPDADLRSFCTDRPTKSSAACTVDAGRFQIESDVLNATFQTTHGVTTDTYLFTNPTFKAGLTNTTDLEFTFAPVETVITRDHDTGAKSSLTGIGDFYTRLKWSLIGDDSGNVAISIAPYVKAPTARQGVGNGEVEEGILLPISLTLPLGWSLNIDPEADALKDSTGTGHHLNYSGLLSFSHPLTKTVTGSVEAFTDVNRDPAGTIRQSSLDFALQWVPPAAPNLQFDGGVNIGLNDATPGAQVYFGVSRRF